MMTQETETNNWEDTNVSTLFYQGITCSQTQLARYTKNRGFEASTGEYVQSQQGIDVIFKPFIGKEIKDVKLAPFPNRSAYVNPLNLIFVAKSLFLNFLWYRIKIKKPNQDSNPTDNGSVAYHGLNFNQISLGQQTDIDSHQQKYDAWLQSQQNPINSNDLKSVILYGVSRGAATTFNAMAQHKYNHVKLAVLEGCFYSINDVMQKTYYWPFSTMAEHALSRFAYKPDGPSPAGNLKDFPENVPVVFISSIKDRTVPYESTKKLAQALADKGQNPVYLLSLKRSSHPNYMSHNATDRNHYEHFMHAIYKKHNLPHKPDMAENGKALIKESLLKPTQSNVTEQSYLPLKTLTDSDNPREEAPNLKTNTPSSSTKKPKI